MPMAVDFTAKGMRLSAKSVPAAVEKLGRRTEIASALGAEQWQEVPLALRERALFSAKVESANLLSAMRQAMRGAVGDAFVDQPDGKGGTVKVLMDKGRFISDMRKRAQDLGLGPTGPRELEDITTAERLGLIYDKNVGDAYGYAQRKVGLDPDVLDAFPAQRMVRLEERRIPRGFRERGDAIVPDPFNSWEARWQRAGDATGWRGALRDDLIALKTSPIWTALSAFGTPWPPFDFRSGMGVVDVSRAESDRLGLTDPTERLDEQAKRAEAEFNGGLEASAEGLSRDELRWLRDQFGKQVVVSRGKIRWRGK